MQAGEGYLGWYIHVDTLVSRASQPEARLDVVFFEKKTGYLIQKICILAPSVEVSKYSKNTNLLYFYCILNRDPPTVSRRKTFLLQEILRKY